MRRCIACKTGTAKHCEESTPRRVFCNQKCQAQFYKIGLRDEELNLNDPEIVGLISANGQKFRIKRELALKLETIRNLVEDAGVDDYIPVPFVNGKELQAIIKRLEIPPVDSDAEFFDLLVSCNYLQYTNLFTDLIFEAGPRLLRMTDADFHAYFSDARLRDLQDYIFAALPYSYFEKFQAKLTVDPARYPVKFATRAEDGFSWACAAGLKSVVSFLLEAKSKIDPVISSEDAIPYAAEAGRVEVVQLLLDDRRLDPAAHENYAIRRAAQNGRAEVMRLLLADQRANPAVDNNHPFRIAVQNQHIEVVRLLLSDPRVDPAVNGNWAIRFVAENEYMEIFYILLADPRVNPAENGDYVFRWAASNGYTEVVRLLLADPRVNPAVSDNWPFEFAVQGKHLEVVKLLLELSPDRGVNPAVHDNWAIQQADESGDLKMVQLLLADERVTRNASPKVQLIIDKYSQPRKVRRLKSKV